MSRWPIPIATQASQKLASDPTHSAWVSAHAGSGKTHVLSQRVVRLLLEGAPPSKILCLTFTKAAAANMSLRVFSILSAWTRMSDEELRGAIADMGADPRRIDLARKLFARTVETPGGLKIQTIHAFCERLLHLFPFEANVAARFEVLTEDKQAELVSMAREQTLAQAMDSEASPLGAALRHVAALTTSFTFDKLLSQALHMRAEIAQRGRHQAGGYARALRRRFGAPADADVATIERDMIEGGIAPSLWGKIAARLDEGGANDKKTAQRLRSAIASEPGGKLDAWCNVFFTAGSKARASMATKALDKDPGLKDLLETERDRLVLLSEQHKAAAAAQRSEALATLSEAIITRYTSLKRTRGLLDFDDLVERTGALLENSKAAWVLYKLDAGIDHILVDEAQDTSPRQWAILEAISGDFFAGESARGAPRTFFAVGDEKQSIFSFQGAAPHAFAEKRRQFKSRALAAQRAFEHVRLHLSFRSAKGVLDEVDNVFSPPEHFEGVVGPDDVWLPHDALKKDLPGLVEIWAPIGPSGKQEPSDWKMPLDKLEESDPPVALARRIADAISRMLAPEARDAVHDKQGALRPVNAGDVLILVRKRGPFFEAVIRALKDKGVPVAGADRLELAEHLAVLDLVAAGRTALLPQDDLTLACVLKSPLIGLDEDDLLALAPRRKGALIAELRASNDPRHRAAAQRLSDWGRRAGESPFRFYARLLGPEGGRRAFLERLGPEAGDAVDEFLKLALEAEMLEAPSLVTFLHRMQSAQLSIKRDMEAAGEAVRVMTVHAAKGLEGKIVFLPDTCGAASGGHDPDIVKIEDLDGTPLIAWRRGSKIDPKPLAEELAATRLREAQEHRRLLYVAMTRAEERLYICGYHGVKGPGQGCWHVLAASALSDHLVDAPSPWDPSDTVRRTGAPALLPAPAAAQAAAHAPAPPPDWLSQPARHEEAPAPPISPSTALASADQGETSDADPLSTGQNADAGKNASGLRIGLLTHTLLQYLPDVPHARRRDAALRFLAARARADLDEATRVALVERACAVLDDPALTELFGPGSRAEVSIAAEIALAGGAKRISGQIDRLFVNDSVALIADFKSGAPRPLAEIPPAYVLQLALYRAAVALLWPGRQVRAVLVWTAGPLAVELPVETLEAALAGLAASPRNPRLDGRTGAS